MTRHMHITLIGGGLDLLYAKPQKHVKLSTGDCGWQEDRVLVGLPLRCVTIVDGEDGCKEVASLSKCIDGKPVQGIFCLTRREPLQNECKQVGTVPAR